MLPSILNVVRSCSVFCGSSHLLSLTWPVVSTVVWMPIVRALRFEVTSERAEATTRPPRSLKMCSHRTAQPFPRGPRRSLRIACFSVCVRGRTTPITLASALSSLCFAETRARLPRRDHCSYCRPRCWSVISRPRSLRKACRTSPRVCTGAELLDGVKVLSQCYTAARCSPHTH